MTDPELQPTGRFDWERTVRRCRIHRDTKVVAYTLAQYGNQDGSRVKPGVPLLAGDCDMSPRMIERHLKILRDLGLLAVARRGGGRGGGPTEYQLTTPSDLFDRVNLAPPEGDTSRGRAHVRRRTNGASTGPVDNGLSDVTAMAPETPDAPAFQAPSGDFQAPNQGLSGANDPSLTCDDAADQETTQLPPKTSPEVSTSPARARADPQPDVDAMEAERARQLAALAALMAEPICRPA